MEIKTIQRDELKLIKAAFDYWKTLQQFDDDSDKYVFDSDYYIDMDLFEYFLLVELDKHGDFKNAELWTPDGQVDFNEIQFKQISKW